MNGPKSIGHNLLAEVEKAGGEEVTVPWKEFYTVADMKEGYVTPAFLNRVNMVLRDRGYISVKNNNGILVRHL